MNVYARRAALENTIGQADPSESAEQIFAAVFYAHYPRVARTIARVIGDKSRAEELAVDVFWKFRRETQAHGNQASGWLHRSAVRAGIDELRRRARHARYERLLRFSDSVTPEDLHAAGEERKQVRAVLAAISARDAELLLLHSDDASYAEIARSLNLNPASVGTLLARARQAFRKEFLKRYGQPIP